MNSLSGNRLFVLLLYSILCASVSHAQSDTEQILVPTPTTQPRILSWISSMCSISTLTSSLITTVTNKTPSFIDKDYNTTDSDRESQTENDDDDYNDNIRSNYYSSVKLSEPPIISVSEGVSNLPHDVGVDITSGWKTCYFSADQPGFEYQITTLWSFTSPREAQPVILNNRNTVNTHAHLNNIDENTSFFKLMYVVLYNTNTSWNERSYLQISHVSDIQTHVHTNEPLLQQSVTLSTYCFTKPEINNDAVMLEIGLQNCTVTHGCHSMTQQQGQPSMYLHLTPTYKTWTPVYKP